MKLFSEKEIWKLTSTYLKRTEISLCFKSKNGHQQTIIKTDVEHELRRHMT